MDQRSIDGPWSPTFKRPLDGCQKWVDGTRVLCRPKASLLLIIRTFLFRLYICEVLDIISPLVELDIRSVPRPSWSQSSLDSAVDYSFSRSWSGLCRCACHAFPRRKISNLSKVMRTLLGLMQAGLCRHLGRGWEERLHQARTRFGGVGELDVAWKNIAWKVLLVDMER